MTVTGGGVRRDGSPVCGARTRSGGTCTQTAGWGTDHQGAGQCKLHGGSTTAGRKHGALVLAEHRAREQVAELLAGEGRAGAPNPVEALLEVHDERYRWMRALQRLVDELDVAALAVEDHTGDLEPHVLVRMLDDAVDRYTRVAKLCIDVNLDERRYRLERAQVDVVVGALVQAATAALAAVGADTPEARRAFEAELARGLQAQLAAGDGGAAA